MDVVACVLFACGALVLVLFRAVWSLRRKQLWRMPKSFDFGAYKSREITVRGVFDKTKWY